MRRPKIHQPGHADVKKFLSFFEGFCRVYRVKEQEMGFKYLSFLVLEGLVGLVYGSGFMQTLEP